MGIFTKTITERAKLAYIDENTRTVKKNYKIKKPLIYIGRTKDAEICIDDKIVTKKHLKIFYKENENSYYLVDLGSTNGTKVNDVLISADKEYKLNSRDIIKIADKYYYDFIYDELEEKDKEKRSGTEPVKVEDPAEKESIL